jgi:hypothetical protein
MFVNLIVLKQLFNSKTDQSKINILFDELLLSKPVANILEKHSNGTSIHQRIELIKVLLTSFAREKKKSVKTADSKKTKVKAHIPSETGNDLPVIKALLNENIVHNFLRVNEFEGITYFNKERFDELLKWLLLFNLIEIPSVLKNKQEKQKKLKQTELDKEIIKSSKNNLEKFLELKDKAESCGYDFIKFQKELDKPGDKKVITKTINKKRK